MLLNSKLFFIIVSHILIHKRHSKVRFIPINAKRIVHERTILYLIQFNQRMLLSNSDKINFLTFEVLPIDNHLRP